MKGFIYFLIIAGIIGAAWFAFPVARERYFTAENEPSIQEKDRSQITANEPESQPDDSATPTDNAEIATEEDDAQPVKEEEAFIDVSSTDCENECSSFQNEADDYRYCKQVCGLDDSPTNPKDGCQSLEGLEIDYCYKDLAISKKDFKICEKIQDKAIKTNCKNRITEDLFDN